MSEGLVDTHAHLDDPVLWQALDAVIARAAQNGLGRILAVGSDLASSRRAVEAARRFPMVYAAVGVHPHEAARFEEEREEVEALLDAEKVVAVGEIGLDYYRMLAPAEDQRRAFATQLRWARDRNVPASVHNRNADDDVLGLVAESGAKVVLHAFSATRETAQRAVDLGACISFAGSLTYPSARTIRDVARELPVDRVLIESDAPVLAPQPRRGTTNEPFLVQFTLECLAGVRAVTAAEMADQIGSTADRVFGWGAA